MKSLLVSCRQRKGAPLSIDVMEQSSTEEQRTAQPVDSSHMRSRAIATDGRHTSGTATTPGSVPGPGRRWTQSATLPPPLAAPNELPACSAPEQSILEAARFRAFEEGVFPGWRFAALDHLQIKLAQLGRNSTDGLEDKVVDAPMNGLLQKTGQGVWRDSASTREGGTCDSDDTASDELENGNSQERTKNNGRANSRRQLGALAHG